MSLIIEFWEENVKVAECGADEVFSLPKDKQDSFWTVQDISNREIRLRIEEGEK